jgi:hypothetical protein
MTRRLAASALALIAVLFGAATAYAAVIGSDNVIHGCYNTKAHKGAHELLVLDTGATCPSNTTPLSWNQQGSQGPAGAPGPAWPEAAVGGGTRARARRMGR